MNKVPLGTQDKLRLAVNHVSVFMRRLRRMMFEQCRPRSKIVPAEVTRDAVQVRLLLTFRRPRFEHCVVNAYVLAFRIQLLEHALEFARTVRSRDLFQNRRGFWQMFAQRVGKRPRAPNKHSAIPIKVSCGNELLSRSFVRLLGESPDVQLPARELPARFDVAVSSLRAIRLDAHHDHVLATGGNLGSLLDYATKFLLV